MLNIKVFPIGPLGTNSYLVWDHNKTGYLFDIGGTNFATISDFIDKYRISLKYMVLTHGHGDHLMGLNLLMEKYPEAEVYIGKEEERFLVDPDLNLAHHMGTSTFIYEGDYHTVSEGDKIGKFDVIDTPGHTIGSKCFYNAENQILIAGDTMFHNSYGRYDLPTGDGEALFASLAKLCKRLPPETRVYSGHTEPTSIGEETDFLTAMRIIK